MELEIQKAASINDAFISYSRKDREFAGALEKALESYKPPKGLSLVQKNLVVFRDEEDFTGVEYHKSIDEHLKSSAKLIVVCSPDARKSTYVNDEILRFARTRGANNIIPVLLRGIPNNEAKAEQVEEMAFPEALIELMEMPLAASYIGFDPARDKVTKGIFYGSWYTILANIYNISRSEIEQRDKKRKARTRYIAIGLVSGVFIILSAALIFAMISRNQAIHRGKIALSRQLAAQSLGLHDRKYDLALLLNLEALNIKSTFEARSSLLQAMSFSPHLDTFLEANRDGLSSASVSPDGNFLALGGDNSINLWDLNSNIPLDTPWLKQGGVSEVMFSPNGKLLASISKDELALWDLVNHKSLFPVLRGHSGDITSIAFSGDGKLIASGSVTEIIVWDVTKRKPLGAPLIVDHGSVTSMEFSPDMKSLFTGGWRKIVTYDVMSRTIKAEVIGHDDFILGLHYIPGGNMLVSGSADGSIKFWNARTLKQLGSAVNIGVRMTCINLSPDRKTLAAGYEDADIVLWDVASRKPKDDSLKGHRRSVSNIIFHSNGKNMISTSVDGTIIVWNIETIHRLGQIQKDHESVARVSFSPDGRFLATGDAKGKIVMTHPGQSNVTKYLATGKDDFVYGVVFSPDSKILASGNWDGTITLWNTDNLQRLGKPLISPGGLTDLAFNPKGTILASTSGKNIMLWDVANRQRIGNPLEGHSETVLCVAFNPTGSILATGSWDNSIILWDVTTQRPKGPPLRAHKNPVAGIAFSPDGNHLVSGSGDGTLILWDVTTNKSLGLPFLGRHEGLFSVAFSPDGNILASGSSDRTTFLWDVNTRQQIGVPLPGHVSLPMHGTIADKMVSVGFSPDGKTLASGSIDSNLIIWDVDIESWEKRACAIVHRNLTCAEWRQYLGNEPYRASCPELPYPSDCIQ